MAGRTSTHAGNDVEEDGISAPGAVVAVPVVNLSLNVAGHF